MDRASIPGRIVLIMQGSGAPGAYQAFQALHEASVEPDWIIGTSSGAINGAIIAGNEVADRVKRLEEFWGHLDPRLPEPFGQLAALVAGVPGFYYLNPALAWGVDARVGIEQAAMYLIEPLKKLLPTVVDFNLINAGKTRLTLGLTNVQTGQIRYFDSRQEKIGLEHVLGSSAIPPSFPAVLIDGEYYWDGGIFSNSPIEVVFDEEPRQSRSCSLSRSGLQEACGPKRCSKLLCVKRTSFSEAGLGLSSCDKRSFIGCAALSAN